MDYSPLLRNMPYLLDGLVVTITLALVSFAGSLIGGTFLALCRLSPWWWLRWPADGT